MSEDKTQENENSPYDVPISGHDYDGIQELDNPLPGWWLYTFFGTMIFGFIYWVHYESGSGPSNEERLAASLALIQQQQAATAAAAPGFDEAAILAFMDSEEAMLRAAEQYNLRCAACHGLGGEGGIGSSFVDGQWTHGEDVLSILKVIQKGVLEKGMPAWEAMMGAQDMAEVAAYVKRFEK